VKTESERESGPGYYVLPGAGDHDLGVFPARDEKHLQVLDQVPFELIFWRGRAAQRAVDVEENHRLTLQIVTRGRQIDGSFA